MKIFLLLILVFYSVFSLLGQTQYMHAYGGTMYIGDYSSSFGFNYCPRINFKLGKNISMGPATDIGLGLQFSSDSYGNSSGSYVVDLPLYLRLNIGHGARRAPLKKRPGAKASKSWPVGVFLGIGYGYNKMAGGSTSNNYYYSTSDFYSGKTQGIYCTFGFSIKPLGSNGVKLHMLVPVTQDGIFVGGIGIFHVWGYKAERKNKGRSGSKRRH